MVTVTSHFIFPYVTYMEIHNNSTFTDTPFSPPFLPTLVSLISASYSEPPLLTQLLASSLCLWQCALSSVIALITVCYNCLFPWETVTSWRVGTISFYHYTVVPPYLSEICSKSLTGCLKPGIVLYIQCFFLDVYTYGSLIYKLSTVRDL